MSCRTSFFFASRRRHTRLQGDWSSDVCSSDLLGGDEFGILLESCSLDEAMRTAETLREGVRNFRFTWEDRVFRLGASIGVVPITADNEDVASILSAADSACGAAKEGGRNRVHSFAENDIELMRRRREMQWAARINAALEEGRFELYRMAIQPLQRVEVGAHYELLLRLKDEGGRIVAPNRSEERRVGKECRS